MTKNSPRPQARECRRLYDLWFFSPVGSFMFCVRFYFPDYFFCFDCSCWLISCWLFFCFFIMCAVFVCSSCFVREYRNCYECVSDGVFFLYMGTDSTISYVTCDWCGDMSYMPFFMEWAQIVWDVVRLWGRVWFVVSRYSGGRNRIYYLLSDR